jgi:1-acyl-sn-glycerol-3-phosphate acyltransferase
MTRAPGRRPPGFWNRATYVFLRTGVRLVLRSYFRMRVVTPPRLAGGFVLVANHSSFLDPLVLGVASPVRVTFLMNTQSYRNPWLRWFYRLNRAIPVDPLGGNREALRAAHAALEAGEVVGVFPEGGISRDGFLLLGNPGAVALVLAKEVAVVPVGLVGVREALPYGASWPRRSRIEVRFGTPIPASELMVGEDRKARLAQATLRIMRDIARLTGDVAREDALARRQSG